MIRAISNLMSTIFSTRIEVSKIEIYPIGPSFGSDSIPMPGI